MSEVEKQKTTKTETTSSLLDQVLSKGFRAKSATQKTEAKRDIETLVGEVLSGVKFGSKNVDKALQARINEIDARYLAADASALPFADARFDVVLAVNVLHHLSEAHLAHALRDAHRVLRPGGSALICEPVENSRVLGLVSALVPKPASGRGRPRRPSILERKAWKAFQETLDDRSLSSRELRRAGARFSQVHVHSFGVLIRLKRFVSKDLRKRLPELDARLLDRAPWLGRFGRHVLVEYRK